VRISRQLFGNLPFLIGDPEFIGSQSVFPKFSGKPHAGRSHFPGKKVFSYFKNVDAGAFSYLFI